MITVPKENFPALTGIRFVAAAMVFVFHYAQIIYAGQPLNFAYYLLRQLNVGVNMFFVLSGFLITYRYFSLRINGSALSWYWWKRAVRILPLYFAVLVLQLLMHIRQHQSVPDALTLFLNVTLLKGLSEVHFFSVMTQSWSLTVEETFYLYAPIGFIIIRKTGTFLPKIALLFFAGSALSGLSSLTEGSFFGSKYFMMSSTFFGRCFEFFVGMYLALLLRKRPGVKSGIGYTVAGGAAVCLVLLAMAGYAYLQQLPYVNHSPFGILLFNYLMPCAIGLFYYGLLVENSRLKSLLSAKPSLLLGKSSYAFYLLHIGAVAQVIYFHVTDNIWLLFLLIQFLSIVAYKYFEKPVYFYFLKRYSLRDGRINAGAIMGKAERIPDNGQMHEHACYRPIPVRTY